MFERVCGLNELELNLKNENGKPKRKLKNRNQSAKSKLEFQSVFENELKREKYNG